MNRRKHHFNSFLLFFIISVNLIFWSLNLDAFPYQTGWPKTINGDIRRSPVVADVDNDGYKEVIFTVHYDFQVYLCKYNGDTYNASWPKSFTNIGGSAPTVADLDNDGDLEIIVVGQYLYAWHHTGDNVNGFPSTEMQSYIPSAPAVGDLTGDNYPEIAAGNWNCEFYIWDNNGNVLNGFPKTFSGSPACGINYTSAIGDIDLDGINEVIIQVYNEHIYAFNYDGSIASGIWDVSNSYGSTYSDITIGDIDNDKILEVLLIAHPQQGGYYPIALNHDTSYSTGWPPMNLENLTPGGLVIGDIDYDGKLDVITGTQQGNNPCSVYIWDGKNGQIKNGWPVNLSDNDNIMRNMIIGDVNGDGSTDIIGVGTYSFSNGRIYAWDVNGNPITGFPIIINGYGPHNSTCFLTDLDNDGDVEIGVAVTDTYTTSKIMIWDLPYPYKGKRMPWPQDRHDPAHTNNYHWYNPLPQVPTLGLLAFILVLILISVLILTKARKSGTLFIKKNRGGSDA